LTGADAVSLSPFFHCAGETSKGQAAEIAETLAHVAGRSAFNPL